MSKTVKGGDKEGTVGYRSYMKKFNMQRDHLTRLEQQRSMKEREVDLENETANNVPMGYNKYMESVEKKGKKAMKKKEKLDAIAYEMAKQEEDHIKRHDSQHDPQHKHAPRQNYRGALEDGEEENKVICPQEYRRLLDEISAILAQGIEMVQVVLKNENITFGDRLHRYVDHTLTQYIIRLSELQTFNNTDITRYKKFAVQQLQYTVNQINTMFWKISQVKSERPKKYKVQKDLLNQWGDTKYSREKHQDRPGLGIPPPRPFEYYVSGQGFVSPHKSRKTHPGHGTFHPHPVHHHSSFRNNKHEFWHDGSLENTDKAFYGSGEYFKTHPYSGHDHWGTLDKLDLGDDLEYP